MTLPATNIVVLTERRRAWNPHEAARRLPPRCDVERRGGIVWKRWPHEAVALQARERMCWGEGVRL